jgi:hypothetical protein
LVDFLALSLSRRVVPTFLLLALACRPAPAVDHAYEADRRDFPNPERGLYEAGRIDLLACGPDGSFVQGPQYRAIVDAGFTLAYDRLDLTAQIERDFRPDELACIRTNLSALRSYGLKAVIRPQYRSRADRCPGGQARIGAFCDATKARAKAHMDQLAPVWEEGSDLIAYFEGGYVGDYGEQHDSEHWDFNPTDDSTCADVKEYWDHLLARTPRDRFVGQREPRVQGNAACGAYADPMTARTAFDGSNNSRMHLWTDGQLKNAYNGGTYWCAPFVAEREYFDRRSDWSLGVGEMDGVAGTCRIDRCLGYATHRRCCAEPRDGCSKADLRACEELDGCDERASGCEAAKEEFARHNYTAIRYYPPRGGRGRQNVDKLVAEGCWDELVKRLGYRLRLVAAKFPESIRVGEPLDAELTIVNDGFGRIYNQRPVYLVWRSRDGSQRADVELDIDPRRWDPSTMTPAHRVPIPARVPADLPAGEYEVWLWLPDQDRHGAGLRADPAYSVRFANTRGRPGDFAVWDSVLGANRLAVVRVVAR